MSFHSHLLSIDKSISNLKLLRFERCVLSYIDMRTQKFEVTAFSWYQKMHFPCMSSSIEYCSMQSTCFEHAKWYEENFSRDRRFSKISHNYPVRDRINRNLAHRNFRLISARMTDPHNHLSLANSRINAPNSVHCKHSYALINHIHMLHFCECNKHSTKKNRNKIRSNLKL